MQIFKAKLRLHVSNSRLTDEDEEEFETLRAGGVSFLAPLEFCDDGNPRIPFILA